jgi:CRP-like cAMP-binding protein
VKVELQRANAVARVGAEVRLSSAPFIKRLAGRWQEVLGQGTPRRATGRTILFQQGDDGHSLLFVLQGEVRVFARKSTDTVELGLAQAGDVVGEGEVLAGQGPRAMSAVAQGPVEFVELPREALLEAGALDASLETWLAERRADRVKALDEMTEFLNRW